MPDLAEEVKRVLNDNSNLAGFYIKRRFKFMGRWLKHGGYYPGAVLRLFRHKKGRVVDAGLREYVVVDGAAGWLKHDMIHDSVKSLGDWTAKHNRYSDVEASEMISAIGQQNLTAAQQSGMMEGSRRLWLRQQIWDRMPILARPVLLFTYRYVFRLGFLDGVPGLIYCFLHDLWYPFLIDAKCKEFQSRATQLSTPRHN